MTRTALRILIVVLSFCRMLNAQSQYRLSVVEEGTYNKLNLDTPLNYNNRTVVQPDWSHAGTASLSLDVDPFSTTLGVSTTANSITRPAYQFSVHELAADLSLSDEINLLVGKKILKWGTGYAFNPTGVIEPQRSPSDPDDRFNQNDGRTLVSLTAFLGMSSLTLVYLNDVQFDHRSVRWGKNEYAFRASTLVHGIDLAFVGHQRQGDRFETGVNCAYVIGENLELHGELLVKKGSSMAYHLITQSDNEQQFYTIYPYTSLYQDAKRIFPRALIGGQFTFDNGINIILEYYHNAEGLNKREWQRWMKFVTFHSAGAAPAPLSRINLLWALNTLSPRGTMQGYVFVRGSWSGEYWSAEAISFLNAADGSMVLIPALTRRLSERASVYARFTSFLGRNGTEFGSLFTSSSYSIGARIEL